MWRVPHGPRFAHAASGASRSSRSSRTSPSLGRCHRAPPPSRLGWRACDENIAALSKLSHLASTSKFAYNDAMQAVMTIDNKLRLLTNRSTLLTFERGTLAMPTATDADGSRLMSLPRK
eukprot:3142707-Prymnesium_polylepis.1